MLRYFRFLGCIAGLTLVIGLVWGRGVLVSADSRASSGVVFHEERKIKPIYFATGDKEYDLAVVGGAGDAVLAKQGFGVVERVFREWFEHVGVKEGRNPSSDELEEIISEIESRLLRRYRELRGLGVEPNVGLLVASVTGEGEPRLYVFDDRGLAEPVHDNPGYVLLGKGVITGGLLLLRLLNYRPRSAWHWDLGLLSASIIDIVSEVDPTVSPFLGESYYIRFNEEKGEVVLGPLKPEAYREYKERVRRRRELFRLLWDVLERMEGDSEERVMKLLQGLVEGESRGRRN